MQKQIAIETTKSAPAVVVTTAVFNGFTISEWLAIVTIVYVVLQASYLVWKWRKEAIGK